MSRIQYINTYGERRYTYDERIRLLRALKVEQTQEKAAAGEITSRAIDLRGLVAAVGAVRQGLPAQAALRMGIVNKCFDPLEREIVGDVLAARIPEDWAGAEMFH